MKAFYLNKTQRTFIAGATYREDDLACLASILDVVIHVAKRPDEDTRFWQVELSDESLKQGEFYWRAKETTFLKLYDMKRVMQEMSEYVIDDLIDFHVKEMIDVDNIKIKDHASTALLYTDQVITSVVTLHLIIHFAAASILEIAGQEEEAKFKECWRIKLNKLIELSAPDKSIVDKVA